MSAVASAVAIPTIRESPMTSFDCSLSGRSGSLVIDLKKGVFIFTKTLPKAKPLAFIANASTTTPTILQLSQVAYVSVEEPQTTSSSCHLDDANAIFKVAYAVRRKEKYILQKFTFTRLHSEQAFKLETLFTKNVRQFQPDRPSNLLLVVNPISGGPSNSLRVSTRAEKIFGAAGIAFTRYSTKGKGDAREVFADETFVFNPSSSFDKFDGIVCVGGDGTVSEVVSGLLLRFNERLEPLTSVGLPERLRVGALPAGTTDALLTTVNETRDLLTAILVILFGRSISIDMPLVFNESTGAFAGCMLNNLNYGFFADTVLRGEQVKKALGPIRFDLAGTYCVLKNRAYSMNIKAYCVTEPTACHRNGSAVANDKQSPSETKLIEANLGGGIRSRLPRRCSSSCFCFESIEGGTRKENQTIARLRDDTVEAREISGSFFSLCITSHAVKSSRMMSGLHPRQHLADGVLCMTLVKAANKVRTVTTALKLLQGPEDPVSDIVEQFDATEICITPVDDENGPRASHAWNLDGELLNGFAYRVVQHSKLLNIFTKPAVATTTTTAL